MGSGLTRRKTRRYQKVTLPVQQKPSSGIQRKALRLRLKPDYGVGDVVVVSVVVLVSAAGVAVIIGVDSAGVVVTVVLVFVVVSVEPAGVMVGFTTVVLLVSPGDAAGAAVSDFCSHATRSAALARMQMYFFIGCG